MCLPHFKAPTSDWMTKGLKEKLANIWFDLERNSKIDVRFLSLPASSILTEIIKTHKILIPSNQ